MSSRFALALLLLVPACGGATPAPSDSGPASLSDAASSTDADTDAAPVDPCSVAPRALRNAVRRLQVGTLERSYIVDVPSGLAAGPQALVLDFHGLGSNAAQQRIYTAMPEAAQARGLIVVHPDGIASAWNAGACCASSRPVDDVAFVRALLDTLETSYCIDRKRVFATGMSNGGFFSYRLACELSDRFAAIASVTGVDATMSCSPTRAVPVLDIHGTADPVVDYGGNPPIIPRGVDATVAGWVQRNGCTGDPVETYSNGAARCSAWRTCRDQSEVELCVITGGGHTWPGSALELDVGQFGPTSPDLDATARVLDFFARHPMP